MRAVKAFLLLLSMNFVLILFCLPSAFPFQNPSDPLKDISENASPRSVPTDMDSYRRTALSQRAREQWYDVLNTVALAEKNGVFDFFLLEQAAHAYFKLQQHDANKLVLNLMEILARDAAK